MKELPNNFFAEQGILNILFTNPTLIRRNISILKKEFFYDSIHQIIYQSICELSETTESITLTKIICQLEDQGNLEKIGGIYKIATIVSTFESFSDLEEYIQIIKEKFLKRLIIELGKQSIDWGYSNNLKSEDIFNKMETALFSLNQEKNLKKMYSSAEIVEDIFLDMKTEQKITSNQGFFSSFKELDSITQGFQKSDLIIIAGRPSMGKTAFSLNLAKNIVEKYQIPILIFTLEMSRQQIIYRMLSSDSKINSNQLKSGRMTSVEWQKLSDSMKKIASLPIYIDDTSNLTLNDIKSKIQRIFLEKKQTGIVIIDYLQLMKSNVKLENRNQEISYFTRNLKLLAKEFRLPIILLSQLSRNVESRVNKRPILSDLRESGCFAAIEKTVPKNVFSWNLKEKIKQFEINFDFKGIKPTYLITFQGNVQIQLTSNHKILTKNGWTRVKELDKNTEIYCLMQLKKREQCVQEYCYHNILQIDYTGLHAVYDKTIPIFHNYFLNNYLVHNSIEQDADVVIMLYREDYYNDKSTESQLTEFIVTKHRNGPVGTARLFFNKSLTTFSNIEKY